jgi:hypothetical protein
MRMPYSNTSYSMQPLPRKKDHNIIQQSPQEPTR